jgi:predicted metal-dependent phosphoesterase TrpH
MRRVALDPHVHSAGSYDCSTPVAEVLAAAVRAGLDAVAITDHDALAESLRARELAPDYGLLAVPAVEVSTADGHLLALGVEEVPAPGRPLAETAADVRAGGGVAIVPHPFQRTRHGAHAAAIRNVDLVETYNAHTVAGLRNRQASRFAAREGYPVTGGSDAHDPALVGRAYTEVLVEPDGEAASGAHAAVGTDGTHDGETDRTAPDVTVEALLDGLRAGRTTVRGGRVSARQMARKYVRNAAIKTLPFL